MKQLLSIAAILLASLTVANNAQAQIFEAIASGNFTSASTWKNGNVPPDSLFAGSITIPNSFQVTLDKNFYMAPNATLDLFGTLSGSSCLFLSDANVKMNFTGVITVDSVYVDYAFGILNVNNNFEPNKLTLVNGAIRSTQSGGSINVLNLYINQGTFSIQLDMAIKSGGHIYMRNTGIPLLSTNTFTLTNNYSVTYEQQSHSTGIEVLGSGLRDVTVNVGNGNELFAAGGINITSGTLKIIEGDVNLSSGTLEISHDGQIDFAGTGKLKSSTDSKIIINKPGKTLNSDLQFKTGANTIKDLTLNSAGDVKLGSDLRVTGIVNFVAGRLDVQNNKLSLITGGTVLKASATSYIVADGGGALVADIAPNTSVNFPIGTSAHYTPCTVTSKNNIPYNGFSASVVADVKNRGTMGSSISGTQPLVNATWLFDHNPPNNIALDVELMWSAGMEVNNFDRGNCYMSHLVGATWDKQSASAATETNGMYSIKREGMTHLSALAVFDGNTVDVPTISKEQTIKVYPNPAIDVLHIDISTPTQAYIYNLQGQLLIYEMLSNNEHSIDVSKLHNGMYYLKLSDNQKAVMFTKQ